MDDQQKKTYESTDISLKMYKKALIFYSVIVFGFVGSAAAIYYYFVPNNSFRYDKVQKSNIPYSSRLQGNSTVQQDIVNLRQKEYAQKTNYRWLNSEKTKISLPIKRAMEITSQEGINPTKMDENTQ